MCVTHREKTECHYVCHIHIKHIKSNLCNIRTEASQQHISQILPISNTNTVVSQVIEVWFSGAIPLTVFTFLGCKKGRLELLRTLGIEIHVGNCLRNWKFYLFNLSIYFLL
jgi:hypothetical protein